MNHAAADIAKRWKHKRDALVQGGHPIPSYLGDIWTLLEAVKAAETMRDIEAAKVEWWYRAYAVAESRLAATSEKPVSPKTKRPPSVKKADKRRTRARKKKP